MNGKIAIIADPKSKGWDFAKEIFEILKQKSDSYELHQVRIDIFKDGETKPRICGNIRGKTCFFIHDSEKNPSQWLTELLLINQAAHKSSPEEIIDVLPYLKFSRQDRKDQSRVPISSAAVADIVNLHAKGVVTIDVHNAAIEGSYKARFDNLKSFPTITQQIKKELNVIPEDFVIMSPDAGGGTRAEAFAKKLGIKNIVIGYKTRKAAGEVEKLQISGDVKNKNVLIIDDIVDSGGTLVKASKVARANGATKVYAYCTHGLFTKGVDHVTSEFDKFFVSNTWPQEQNQKLRVINLAPLFAETIYRMSHGKSLSELFE